MVSPNGINADDGSMAFFFLSYTRLQLGSTMMAAAVLLPFCCRWFLRLLFNASCTNTCAVDVTDFSCLFEDNTQDEDSYGQFGLSQPMRNNHW